jgi:hypothetical protein
MGTSVAPTVATSLVLGALVYKVTDLIKYLRALWAHEPQTRQDGKNGLISLGLSSIAGVTTGNPERDRLQRQAEVTGADRPT